MLCNLCWTGTYYSIFAKFKFEESDLQYLKETQGYEEDFIDYLRNLKLKLTIRSMKEGELVFANEPILQVEGPLAQCQLVETMILNIINFQTLLVTKAARIKLAVKDDGLMEFGTRRAQEADAAIWVQELHILEALTQLVMFVPESCLEFQFLELMLML